MERCGWGDHPRMTLYHDTEWGVPVHDDRVLFEFLTLEGAQAGLSWLTILQRREGYRQAFAGFDPAVVAQFDEQKVQELLGDSGIIRHRGKIASTITNAQAFLKVQAEFGSFDAYVWRFAGGSPRINAWQTMTDVPAKTAESDALSKDLRRRGFKFVGSTICYSFMQAVGMVNDHTVHCFRYAELVRPQ